MVALVPIALILCAGILFVRRHVYWGISTLCVAFGLGAVLVGSPSPSDTAKRNVCIDNLRRIEEAKLVWAKESGLTNGTAPTILDLGRVDKHLQQLPVCPEGGVYQINPPGQKPVCSLSNLNHRIEELTIR